MPVKRDKNWHRWAVANKGNRSRVRRALIPLAACLVIVITMLITADTAAPAAPVLTDPLAISIAAPANWKLAFSTDFSGNKLDTSTWSECYLWSPSPLGCTNFGNSDEREWYLPSQVHVENGALALVAQRTPTEGTNVNGSPKTYTCRSGMVTTYPSVHLKYGLVQVVARLPFGKGLWPAIWLVPVNGEWPPEIDIVEHWDTELTSRSTLHTRQGTQQRGTIAFPDADKGWHTFTLYWTPSRISVYYDSKLALTTTTGIPQLAMYLILDLADENNSPGSCSGTMYVKSVNIWEPA
jgi:beta-glucanase (GH16 family)